MSGVARFPCTWIRTGRPTTWANSTAGSTVDHVAALVEVHDLEVGPGVGAHLLRAVAGADVPEVLDPIEPGLEVVEEDERPAGPGVEGAVEEVLVAALADPRARGARVEDAPGPRPHAPRRRARGDAAPRAFRGPDREGQHAAHPAEEHGCRRSGPSGRSLARGGSAAGMEEDGVEGRDAWPGAVDPTSKVSPTARASGPEIRPRFPPVRTPSIEPIPFRHPAVAATRPGSPASCLLYRSCGRAD